MHTKTPASLKSGTCVGESCQGCSDPACYAGGGTVKGVHHEESLGESRAGKDYRLSKETKSPDTDHHAYDNLGKSRSIHKENLHEIRSMPAPKIKGLAHGGQVRRYKDGGDVDSDDSSPGILESAANWLDSKSASPDDIDINTGKKMRPSGDQGAKQTLTVNRPKAVNSMQATQHAHGGEVDAPDAIDAYTSDDKEEGMDHDDSEINDILGKELMEAFHSKDHKRVMESIEACVLQCLDKDGE